MAMMERWGGLIVGATTREKSMFCGFKSTKNQVGSQPINISISINAMKTKSGSLESA